MEASFNGTIRTILVLAVLWLLLRLYMRSRQASSGPQHGPFQGDHTASRQRPKGEVRIERIDRDTGRRTTSTDGVEDADFEEIR